MRLKLKMLLVGLVAGAFAVGIGGSALALAPNDPMKDCVEQVLNLPALDVCKDAKGLHLMKLPAIGVLREPATPKPAAGKTLPKTGVNVGDFAAIGLAALAGGSVLLRRLRVAVS